jgi:hypothetical protein
VLKNCFAFIACLFALPLSCASKYEAPSHLSATSNQKADAEKTEKQNLPKKEVEVTKPILSQIKETATSQSLEKPVLEAQKVEPSIADTWPVQGFQSPGYGVFRDELMFAILQAKTRVAIVTEEFHDGDIATALYRAKLKGVKVLVVLNSSRKAKAQSKGNYLSRVGITTMVLSSPSAQFARNKWGGRTSFVLDDKAFRLSSVLDERQSGSVKIDGSPFTADEIFSLETEAGAKRFLESPEVLPSRKKKKSSNPKLISPTETSPSGASETSKSTESGVSVRKAPEASSKNSRAKRLPRETIIQKRSKGVSVPLAPNSSESGSSELGTVPVKQPPAPDNESELAD